MNKQMQAALADIQTAFDELQNAGLIEPTGEMRWHEKTRQWDPVYAFTELGRALSEAGIDFDEYLKMEAN